MERSSAKMVPGDCTREKFQGGELLGRLCDRRNENSGLYRKKNLPAIILDRYVGSLTQL